MKKILGLLFVFIMSLNLCAYSANIEVLGTMQSKTTAEDKVWVGTFQLVWNDFIDWFVHDIVRFREGTPALVQDLNKKEFTTADISDACYYKKVGTITKRTKKEIQNAIKKKFNETSDILDNLDLTPGSNRILIYAMLKKDFEFLNEFDKLNKSVFGSGAKAEYFGITKGTKKEVKNNVRILFYNSKNDFAVVLKTKGGDEVYLYKNDSNKPFNLIYNEMNSKSAKYKGSMRMGSSDELKVPNIKFNIQKQFKELAGKRVMGTNIMITDAIESIKFDMNNKGVKLKSEAAMTAMLTAMPQKEMPKLLYFDNTFVIFLKEKDKQMPYFALRVHDIKNYQ